MLIIQHTWYVITKEIAYQAANKEDALAVASRYRQIHGYAYAGNTIGNRVVKPIKELDV